MNKKTSGTLALGQPAPAPVAATTVVAATPASTPLYKKWWPWTAVAAVVVAAGAGAGIGLAVALRDAQVPSTALGSMEATFR